MPIFQQQLGSYYRLELEIALVSQDVGANSSNVSWGARVVRLGSTWHARSGTPGTWDVSVGGAVASGATGYDFSQYTTLQLGSGTATLAHNGDGTLTFNSWLNWSDSTGTIPNGTAAGVTKLPTIPRATSPLIPNDGQLTQGVAYTIGLPRASTGFKHNLSYTFRGQEAFIAYNVAADSYSWTPPASMLTAVTDAVVGYGSLWVDTYDADGRLVGRKGAPFGLHVPASVVPTIGGLTAVEATPNVAAWVGRLVQGVSKLTVAASGVAGASGSTVVSTRLEVLGGSPGAVRQSLTGASGTTQPITDAGTVTVRATVTDSRGRTGTRQLVFTGASSVLPYLPPQVGGVTVRRVTTAAGTAFADTGLYARIDLTTAISSLLNSTERNTGSYRVSYRDVGGSAWTADKSGTRPIGASTAFLVAAATQPTTTSREYLVEVIDRFGTVTPVIVAPASAQVTLASDLLLDFAGADGVGVKKRWQRGALDVAGPAYFTGQVYAGGNLTAPLVAATTAMPSAGAGFSLAAGSNLIQRLGGLTTLIFSATNPSGVPGGGAVVGSIPAGFRPSATITIIGVASVGGSAMSVVVTVNTDGTIRCWTAGAPNQVISLTATYP